VGDPPELACARYAEAVGVLGNGSLLLLAARFYLERHPSTLPQITHAEAAAEMIELRRRAKASGPYLIDLHCRMGPFTKAYPVHPASVTTADCQRYLDGLTGASSTKNATRQILWRLFAHCESRGYIPRDSNPVAETQRLNVILRNSTSPSRRLRRREPVRQTEPAATDEWSQLPTGLVCSVFGEFGPRPVSSRK
jgi:hypothetical protein